MLIYKNGLNLAGYYTEGKHGETIKPGERRTNLIGKSTTAAYANF